MIKKFDEYEILNEGKFDTIIGQITSDIYQIIKDTGKKSIKLENEYTSPFNFIMELVIDRNYKKYVKDELDYQIFDAWSDVVEGKSFLSLTIILNPSKEPEIYNELIGEIKGSLRHELEHLTQFGPNRIKGKPFNTNKEQREFNKRIEKGDMLYVLSDKTEIPAYVRGLYKRAKTEKKPIEEVFNDRLDFFVRMERITKKQKSKILYKWIKYAKKNLPDAHFSE